MSEQKWDFIDQRDDRELYRWQIKQPDGEWITRYRGRVFTIVEGQRLQTPDDPFFPDEEAGQQWLGKKP